MTEAPKVQPGYAVDWVYGSPSATPPLALTNLTN